LSLTLPPFLPSLVPSSFLPFVRLLERPWTYHFLPRPVELRAPPTDRIFSVFPYPFCPLFSSIASLGLLSNVLLSSLTSTGIFPPRHKSVHLIPLPRGATGSDFLPLLGLNFPNTYYHAGWTFPCPFSSTSRYSSILFLSESSSPPSPKFHFYTFIVGITPLFLFFVLIPSILPLPSPSPHNKIFMRFFPTLLHVPPPLISKHSVSRKRSEAFSPGMEKFPPSLPFLESSGLKRQWAPLFEGGVIIFLLFHRSSFLFPIVSNTPRNFVFLSAGSIFFFQGG